MAIFDTSELTNPKIPWGKYSGTAFRDLPNDYLLWLLEKAEMENLKPSYLNKIVRDEWKRRQTEPTTS